jgi:hypothetical protein
MTKQLPIIKEIFEKHSESLNDHLCKYFEQNELGN